MHEDKRRTSSWRDGGRVGWNLSPTSDDLKGLLRKMGATRSQTAGTGIDYGSVFSHHSVGPAATCKATSPVCVSLETKLRMARSRNTISWRIQFSCGEMCRVISKADVCIISRNLILINGMLGQKTRACAGTRSLTGVLS